MFDDGENEGQLKYVKCNHREEEKLSDETNFLRVLINENLRYFLLSSSRRRLCVDFYIRIARLHPSL